MSAEEKDEFDDYLAANSGFPTNGDADEFDDYLKKHDIKKPSSAPKPKTSAGMAALDHLADVPLFGQLPHAQARLAQFMPNPNADLDEDLRAQGFKLPEDKFDYVSERDKNIERFKQEGKEHPVASAIGTGAGMVASAVMPGAVAQRIAKLRGIAPAAKAISLGDKIKSGAKTGAVLGALQNPGDVEGKLDPLQFGGRAKGAAIGGVLGAAIPYALDKGSNITKKVSKYLKDKSERLATRSLGRANPKMAEKMAESGQDKRIGKMLLKEDAIPVLGTPGRIQKRVEKLKEAAGERVSDLIDDAERAGVDSEVKYTPVKFHTPKKLVKTKDEVRFSPVRFDENPIKRSMPWLKDSDAPAKIVRGEEQVLEHALFEKPQTRIIKGNEQTLSGGKRVIDTEELAKKIMSSPEIAEMRRIPGMESTVAAIEKQVETLAKNKTLTLKEAQKLRQGIDKSINFNKSVPEMRGAQDGLYKQRSAIRDAMNDRINEMSPGMGKDALKKANFKYSDLVKASDISAKEMGRQQSNRGMSLTDTIAAAGGLASGGPASATALGLLNKAARTVGSAAGARAAQAGAKGAAITQANLKKVNPKVAAFVAQKLGRGQPDYKKEQMDPALLKAFQENPELIESVKDPKLKAKIMKALGGDK